MWMALNGGRVVLSLNLMDTDLKNFYYLFLLHIHSVIGSVILFSIGILVHLQVYLNNYTSATVSIYLYTFTLYFFMLILFDSV